MNQDMSSSHTDSTKSSSDYGQPTHNTASTDTGSSARRVRVYDRPDSPSTQTISTMITILFLIAIAIAVYYFFFAA